MASKWGDLTDAQKERLVAISRGEHSSSDSTWRALMRRGLVGYCYNQNNDSPVDYLTPAGGALLAERDRAMIAALEFYATASYEARVTTYNTGDYDLDCPLLYEGGAKAREALAAVAKEHGE